MERNSIENVMFGPSLDTEVSKECLGRQLFEAFREYAKNDSPAFIDASNGIVKKYSETLDLSLKIAQYLSDKKFKPGDILSVCSENHVNFFAPIFAAFFQGLCVAPINNTYSIGELIHVIKLSKPNIIFCSKSTFSKLVTLQRRKFPFLRAIVVTDEIELTLKNESNNCATFKPVNVNLHDNAILLFSSGTTGLPKAVMLTHENVNIRNAQAKHKDVMSPYRTRALSVSPFFHAMGLFYAISFTLAKQPLIFLQKFNEKDYLRTVEKYKITFLHVVPPLMVFLAKNSLVEKYDLSSVQEISCGAAPLGKEVEEMVRRRFNVECVRQAYGMTETTLATLAMPVNALHPSRVGSVGRVMAEMQCIVRDPETGAWLGPNAIGELCFKGANVMKGYYGDPLATNEVFTEDGWLKTGDLGYYDPEEFFYIVDRLKELIKYKGFQVPPTELEAILLSHPKVKEAAVVGLPDEVAGELPLAFVVKQENVSVTESELKAFVARQVSTAKILRGGVKFISTIPKNPNGKILRRVLRDSLRKFEKSKL